MVWASGQVAAAASGTFAVAALRHVLSWLARGGGAQRLPRCAAMHTRSVGMQLALTAPLSTSSCCFPCVLVGAVCLHQRQGRVGAARTTPSTLDSAMLTNTIVLRPHTVRTCTPCPPPPLLLLASVATSTPVPSPCRLTRAQHFSDSSIRRHPSRALHVID